MYATHTPSELPLADTTLRFHMPRIPPSLIWKARSISRLLPLLLPICRDLRLARSELRWLKEHAIKISQGRFVRHDTPELLLEHYVARRARGEPLQYILGSEYFGDLEVKCRPDVLIPRFVRFIVSLLLLHSDPSLL